MWPRKFSTGVALLILLSANSVSVRSAETFRCYRCEKENCEDPVSAECLTLKENDKCFIRFDANNNDIVEMGCLSDFVNKGSVQDQIKNKTLYTCSGVDCNALAKLPTPNQCTECSSRNEEACATKPAAITKQKLCNSTPYNQCYQRVKSGITTRGCLYELEGDDFYNCLTGGDDKCDICEGKHCNGNIIPSDRKRCHRCSSETDANCHDSPSALSVCPVYEEIDACVAVYENGITRRGCKTEFVCDLNSKNCQVCSYDGCNTANIKKRFDELYGIFQDLPLNCNSCKGNDCEQGKPLYTNKCEGDIYQDCMTVFDTSGKVIRRGCENLVLAEQQPHCDAQPELCFRCKANGCNNVTDNLTYKECLYCDSATSSDCLFNPNAVTKTRKCVLGCVSSLYRRKSNSKLLDLARTCFEDIEFDNRESCTADRNCAKCLDSKCNTDVLPTEGRLSCLHCNGDNCGAPTSKLCLAYNLNDMCYIYFDNVTLNAVRMGCRSDVVDDQLKAEIKQYFICDGNDCNDFRNVPNANLCTVCDSEENVECAIAPIELSTTKKCSDSPYTQCFTRIREGGHTQRGCLSELPNDIFISCHDGLPESKCMICTGKECNKNIFPPRRQWCYVCDSSTDANCESDPNKRRHCPRFVEQDACVTKWIKGTTRRDCASEMSCDGLGYANCRKCSKSGCNNMNLAETAIDVMGQFTNLPLRCHQCNGTVQCQNLTGTASACTGNINQLCTTVFNANGVVLARGCSDSFEILCSTDGNMCYSCKSNACNVASYKHDYVDCVYCDSKYSDNCVFNVDAVQHTRKCYKSCMTSLYPRYKDEKPAHEIIRSCLDDKDLNDRTKCESSEDPMCKSCTGNNCNKDALGSRKSCYQCKGADCKFPSAQMCRAVMDHDQCFLQWDEKGSVVEMGCKSKYEPLEVETLVKKKHLWLCDEDNCNHIQNVPKSQTCVACNSEVDANCALKPNALTSTTTCGKLPYTQCYSRVLQNGHTERGCLSNLDHEDFLNCLYRNNSAECLACTGEKCNQAVYPSSRLSCHTCSSSSSAACEYNPDAAQICLLHSRDSKCVTSIDTNGVTTRGCSSKVSCAATNVTFCQECEVSACNVGNLKRKADGKPGQWQSLPLTCLSCKSFRECSSKPSEQLCTNSEYCMTVFDAGGDVLRRGCSGAVEKDHGSYCDLNSSNCLSCNSNLCNKASSLSNIVDCVYCDSKTNPDCAFNSSSVKYLRKCDGGCMSALYPTLNNYSYEVVRTCLSDKDPADQIACKNENSPLCKFCSSSVCNTHKLPESRLSCFHCQGENCENAQQSECSKYKPDDQCFIQFNNVSDIVRMGCIGELEEDFVTNNFHTLYTCSSGDNCNGYDNLPKPNHCYVCNSNNEEDCASNPDNILNLEICSTLPNTHCHTKVNKDGSTVRGCVNSLEQSEVRSCLAGTDSECVVCSSDKCNSKVFPLGRRSCQRCNSKDNPKCESSPNFGSICPAYSEGQFCATKLVNGHTYRGCSTDFQCDDSDKQYCRMCRGADNCNVVDLAINNIGYPGKWQDVPIKCYTCKNEECNRQVQIQQCSKNSRQNCATVFAQNGTVIQRGCSDLIYSGENFEYCDKHGGYCKFCKSNGCNTAEKLEDFGDCLFCEGANSQDCVSYPKNIKRTRSCLKGCMTGLYPRTNKENPAYELARGCRDDLELQTYKGCKTGENPYCEICNGTSCNTVKIPAYRLRCNFCNGVDCNKPKSAECRAFRENDQCFMLFVEGNNVERMGCASDFDSDDLNALGRQLLLCDGDNCNTLNRLPTPIACKSCNSSNNPECAHSPKAITLAACRLRPRNECYTRIDKYGITHRGCLSDVDDDIFADCSGGNSSSCKVCSTSNCNFEVYPKGRRSCIQCNSDSYSSCEDRASDFARICTFYDESESCVTKLEGNQTIRGCASDISCSNHSTQTCRACNKSDNCNTVNLLASYVGEPGKWQDLPLSCYHCKGNGCSKETGALDKCKGNNLQTCMTVFNADGIVIQRGCSDDVLKNYSEYCDENSDKCFACKSNACNNAKSVDDYVDCYFCDSLLSSSCFTNFNTSKIRTRKCQKGCMVAFYPSSNFNASSHALTRSCLDDMELSDRDKCAKNSGECISCNGSLCNTMNVGDEWFECYKCVDKDCEDMKPEQCFPHDKSGQCYTLFNKERSIEAVGCRSELTTNSVTELIRKKLLRLCNETKCNAPENLPTPKLCSVCNSAENPLCATNPNLVDNFQRCATVPFTECFTRINGFGHTERGCLGSLTNDDFYSCLTNTDDLCETCIGDKCNEIDIYPRNRTQCYHCNSLIDPKCTTQPNSYKVCELYVKDDNCITHFRNGVTARGCKSNLKCDNENDPRTCRSCTKNFCNTINMKKLWDNGFPGRWQDIPITCYTCKGEVECSSKGYFRPCLGNPVQSCITVFNAHGNVTEKGCSDLVESENLSFCNKNPDKCLLCHSNGCNEASDLSQYVKCSYCDTEATDGGKCISNASSISTTRQCYKYCMTALFPRFKEQNPSYDLSRSCYDDMDFDDRERCAAGKYENCKVCNTPNCNIIDMPETRLSCYICSGDDCHAPTPRKCSTYRPVDKCYSRFNEKGQPVAFGCRSELTNAEADYLFKEKRLLLCDDNNCNSVNNIPDPQTCALCNSRVDRNCSVNPAAVIGETKCDIKPFTSCYTRVLADGATERGCLSSLYDDEFSGCLNGTSTTCKSCSENYCNTDVFPKYRLKCQVCNSSVDPNCESSPNSLKICYNYDPEDTCVTALSNSVTYRDCSSSLLCDVKTPATCQKCSGDGCNVVILTNKDDDNFGKWQDLPLTCLSCLGGECNSGATTKSLTCELNNKQDCITVFNDNDTVIARGCSDSIEKEYCLGKKDNCYKCKSNKCNGASSKLEYEECIYCNSYNDPECVWNPSSATHRTRKCQGGCMTALFPSFNSDNSSYELIRTCLNDKELSDQKTCADGKDRNCSTCKGNKCNTHKIPTNRLSCFICKDEACETPGTKICPLYKENDKCFIRFDKHNSVSEMGCISSLQNQDLESIIKTKRIRVCEESNCNNLEFLLGSRSCATCDSEEDISCAVSPTYVKVSRSCTMLPYTNCYTKLTEGGRTRRGCLSDLSEDEFAACVLGNDKHCSVCNESGCNRKIFPKDRQQCFTCASTKEPNCHSFPTTKKPCPIVSDSETCITALSGNVTVRGCKSLVICDASDFNSCRSCFGSECNSIDLLNKHDDGYHGIWQELPLKCHTCKGEHCFHSLGPAVNCSNRNINQDCMTVFDEKGRVERRGCSDDVEDYKDLYCRQHPESCFKCKSNACNTAWKKEEYVECLFCDSFNQSSCVFSTEYSGFATRKCHKNCMVAMRNQQIIRSCLDDKESWVQHRCQQTGSKECAACSGKNCNNFVFPNDRLKCHVCTDASCTSSVSQYCEIYESDDFCFAKYENGFVHLMGCGSSQNSCDIIKWTTQNNLYKCEENDCNELPRLPGKGRCISCNSSETPNCAQSPSNITTAELCPAPNNKCASIIDSKGHVIRGCASNLPCISSDTCDICTGETCNNQIHPSDRRKCHICSSQTDNNCRKNPTSLTVCPIYKVNDMCVSALDYDGNLQRGCASQLQCTSKDKDYCNICNTNGCNIIELKGSSSSASPRLSVTLSLILTVTPILILKY